MRKFIVFSLTMFLLLIQLAIAQSSTNDFGKAMSPAELLKYDMDYSQKLQDMNMLGAAIDAMREGIRRYANSLKQSDLVTISYTNEIKTLQHDRCTDYIYASNNANMVVGYKTESTNMPVAIVHSVTYGRGTNAIFVLKTQETLNNNSQTSDWQNVTGATYRNWTWVESQK